MITKDTPQTQHQSVDQTSDSNGQWVALDAKPEEISYGDKAGNGRLGKIGDTMADGGDQLQGGISKLPNWLQTYANPFKATMTLGTFYSSLQPVSEFVIPTNFSKPTTAEALYRIKKNGRHFWANYCVITLVIIFISIITSPKLLVVMSLFVWMWSKVLDDEFMLYKLKLKRKYKVGLMTVLSVLGMIYFASGTIFWSLGTGVVLSTTHASFHLLPKDEYTGTVEEDLELGFLEK